MFAVEIIALIRGKEVEKAVDRAAISNQTERTVMSRGPNVECSAALMRNKSQMGAELR
jgi:hypothetical protein